MRIIYLCSYEIFIKILKFLDFKSFFNENQRCRSFERSPSAKQTPMQNQSSLQRAKSNVKCVFEEIFIFLFLNWINPCKMSIFPDIDATCSSLGYHDGIKYHADPDFLQCLKVKVLLVCFSFANKISLCSTWFGFFDEMVKHMNIVGTLDTNSS